jgi:hypothetical protein
MEEIRSIRSAEPTPSSPDPAAEAAHFQQVGVGLVIPGSIAAALGIVLVAVGVGGGGSSSKNCSTGKRCGNTCIEMTDVCHIPSGDGESRSGGGIRPRMMISGGVVALVGIGLIIGSVFAFRRATRARERVGAGRRSVWLEPTVRGWMLRF